MKQYLNLLEHIKTHGSLKNDRTGTGTKSIFGYQMRFNLEEGFPIITTKKIHLKSIIYELLWFLKGSTNIKYLNDHGVTIWDEWADENGDLGPIYGKQWVSWDNPNFGKPLKNNKIDFRKTINQIERCIKLIKTEPNSRRIIVNAWNVADLDRMALTPCHAFFQFYVCNGKLSCHLYQRSCDVFLGLPFNISSYALLTHMIAQQCDLGVGEFIWSGGDVHIYSNHNEQVNLQLSRTPYELPKLIIKRKPKSIIDYYYEDFELVGYKSHKSIKAPISI